LTFTDLLSH